MSDARGGVVRRPRFALSAPVPLDSQRAVEEAHAWLTALGGDAGIEPAVPAVRPEVWASWQRSIAAGVSSALSRAPEWLGGAAVESLTGQDRWAVAVEVVGSMLVDDAAADGMVVVLADAEGHVAWTGGAWSMAQRAAAVGLVPGARWAEDAVGTNAVGTSLSTGECCQVLRAEHHVVALRPFAGAAAPLRDEHGQMWGTVALMGGDHVATPAVLALVRFVAHALSQTPSEHPAPVSTGRSVPGAPLIELLVLGRSRGLLRGAGAVVELSPRHTDLLLCLAVAAERAQGRHAEELAVQCWDPEVQAITVRAEMYRLRRFLPGTLVSSRPYQLAHPIRVDALEVLSLLRRGAHRRAMELYRGPLLPRSTAPSTVVLRDRVARHVRQALVAHAHVDLLIEFADTVDGDDPAIWQAVLDRVLPGSPRHTEARLRLNEVEARLLGY
ncbi:MAG: hypothetical protein JWQ53_3255 [Klenkia sp.]|nr:hypothetical protein [Klenkia sp.]